LFNLFHSILLWVSSLIKPQEDVYASTVNFSSRTGKTSGLPKIQNYRLIILIQRSNLLAEKRNTSTSPPLPVVWTNPTGYPFEFQNFCFVRSPKSLQKNSRGLEFQVSDLYVEGMNLPTQLETRNSKPSMPGSVFSA